MGYQLSSIRSHNWVTSLVAKLFLAKDERHFFYVLYSYFRWLDDFVDERSRSERERKEFISGQDSVIRGLYQSRSTDRNGLIGRIVQHDLDGGCRLKPLILTMLDTFRFDLKRANAIVSFPDLENYSRNLGSAYAGLLLCFVEPSYKCRQEDILLAHACHLVHMLRDFNKDRKLGYLNISQEEIEEYNIRLGQVQDENFRGWLKDRIEAIQRYFVRGKAKLNENPVLRLKIIGHLYCFRYETVLRQIRKAGYRLKDDYSLRFQDVARLILTSIFVPLRHLWQTMNH